MIVTTIDPVTGSRVINPENHPYVIEGTGMAALKIYFESETSRQTYLSAPSESAGYFTDMDEDSDEASEP